ncbi:hypothetical protein FO519_008053 [Halicephalobus sp. NKZ332]|nr:hypothetical protein FO519_008053 [Halicephalobus sp. NKZ332]
MSSYRAKSVAPEAARDSVDGTRFQVKFREPENLHISKADERYSDISDLSSQKTRTSNPSTPLNQQPAVPSVPYKYEKVIEVPSPSSSSFPGGINPIYLPSVEKPVKVYSFPTPDKVVMEAPTILSLIIEKVEPTKPVYQKFHRKKKVLAEKVFRARMNDLMKTLETFDPMDHVKSTIQRAKQEWSVNLAPSGKKKYPHWSELMDLEELYGVEKSDYIDKRAGLPDEETAQKIAQKRKEYLIKYSLNPKSEKPS